MLPSHMAAAASASATASSASPLQDSDQMSDELDESAIDEICHITDTLIREVTGEVDLRRITLLDLHMRNPAKGKIRRIEGLKTLSNLRMLNLSYNAITVMEGLQFCTNLIELNLAENGIRKVSANGFCYLHILPLASLLSAPLPNPSSSAGELLRADPLAAPQRVWQPDITHT